MAEQVLRIIFYRNLLLVFFMLALSATSKNMLFAGSKTDYAGYGDEASREVSVSLFNLMDGIDKLVDKGMHEEARMILEALKNHTPNSKELQFFIGMAAMGSGYYDIAIEQFENLLYLEPEAVRVRLELARAYFESGRDDKAYEQFKISRSGSLPSEVVANINGFLLAIRERRVFSWNAGISIAPDSNINAAPSLEEVSIFGAPFKLSDDARRKTGLGLLVSGGAEWAPPISDSTHLRIGGQLYHSDYAGSQFDDTIISSYLGPRITFNRGDFSPLIAGFYRWYGGSPYNYGYGLRVEGGWYPSYRLRLGYSLERLKIEHDLALDLDGYRTNGALSGSYAFTPTSGLHSFLGASRESAELSMLSSNSYRIGGGYYTEMREGVFILIQPEHVKTYYDESIPAFGTERKDKIWRIRLELSNRSWTFKGFTPTLAFIHTDRSSNIDLYSYSRNQVMLGLKKVF